MSALAVGPCGAAFADLFAALHAACFARPWARDAFALLLAGPDTFGLLATGDGQPAGMVVGRAAAGEAEIITLGVAPDRRRLGVGAALVEAALTTAAERGAVEMFLEVGADNLAARRLYERAGFLEIGRRPAYYQATDGRRTDALVLRRVIDPPCG